MKKLFLLSSIFFCSTFCFAQSGELDPTFGKQGIVTADMGARVNSNSTGKQVLIAPGGGSYILLNYPPYITKRLPNGSLDSTYGILGYSRAVPFNEAFAALQADGKIVIVGAGFHIARLNTNGSLDSTFGTNGMQTGFNGSNDHDAIGVAIQADAKIVVVGNYTIPDPRDIHSLNSYFAVARYNPDGSPDNTFNGTGEVTTDFGLTRPPEQMGETGPVAVYEALATTVAIQADGKIVVGGGATGDNDYFAIARYNTNGGLDSTFSGDGLDTSNVGARGYSIALQTDGKIVLAGYVGSSFAVIRRNTDGSPDNSFNGTGGQTINVNSSQQQTNAVNPNSVAIQADGKIVIAGYGDPQMGTKNDFTVVRFNTDGSLDDTFDTDGLVTTDFSPFTDPTPSDDFAGSVAIQGDGKIMVAGSAGNHFGVARYNMDGSLDNSFEGDGQLVGNFNQGNTTFYSMAIGTNGKIVAAGFTFNGTDKDFAVARYNNDGSPDSSFNNNGKQITDFGSGDENVSSVVIQNDGKVIAAGGNGNNQFAIARYNADGSLDNTFNSNGKLILPLSAGAIYDVCTSVALQNDGKIVLGGWSKKAAVDSIFFEIIRLNNDGSLDNSFGTGGKQLNSFQAEADAIIIQIDGKIVASGASFENSAAEFIIARYNTDGSLDNSFANNGVRKDAFGPDNYFGNSLAIQIDGKLVVGGYSESASGNTSSYEVARYNTNGTIDSTFNGVGFQSTALGTDLNFATSVAVTDDGRIALGGTNDNFGLILYKNDGSLDNSFGNGGTTITGVGVIGSRINGMKIFGGKIYAAGTGQFPGSLGVLARYLIPGAGPLPVSLLDFTGALQNKSVLLQWKIATQKNLATFVIERSADGNKFLPINTVAAGGVSVSTKNYSITDDQPLQGINFYRLKMVDIDGKFTYSNIVAVRINAVNKLQIFPNPSAKILFVDATGNNENAVAQIIDESGRKLKEVKVFLNGETSFSIDISNLANGVYNLVLRKNDKTEVETFIKR